MTARALTLTLDPHPHPHPNSSQVRANVTARMSAKGLSHLPGQVHLGLAPASCWPSGLECWGRRVHVAEDRECWIVLDAGIRVYWSQQVHAARHASYSCMRGQGRPDGWARRRGMHRMKPTTKLPLRNNGSTLIEPCAYRLGMGHGFRLRLAIDKVGIIPHT